MPSNNDRRCSVAGCEGPVVGRELCSRHWKRWRRYGNPLGGRTAWADTRGFIDSALRHADEVDCLLWPYTHAGNGYGKVSFGGKANQFVHRVICEMFRGPPPSRRHYASHSCGCGHLGCVNPHHVFWKTPKENSADQKVHGTVNRGERNGGAKLLVSQVIEIKGLVGKFSQRELSDRFGVSRATISDIQRGRRWTWLGEAFLQEGKSK